MVVEVLRDVHTIVRVTGEVDFANVNRLESALDRACADAPTGFVVDASAVSYIDGSGVRAILSAWERTRESGGTLSLVQSGIVGDILDAIGVRSLPGLLVHESAQSAADALSSGTGDSECFRKQ